MVSIFWLIVVLLIFVKLWITSRAAVIAAFFILFPLISRTFALAYVDLEGPIFSYEIGEDVGGGPSMPFFAISVIAFLLPLTFMFRTLRLRVLLMETSKTRHFSKTVQKSIFIFLILFVFVLYVDLFSRGPIPLFHGIDRLDYNRDMAGSFHPYVFDFGFLLAALISIFFVYPRVLGKEFDFRFLLIYSLIMVYYALTGNRFSAFYSFTSFFFIPIAVLPLLSRLGRLAPLVGGKSVLHKIIVAKSTLFILLSFLFFCVGWLLWNNLVSVRGYDDPAEQFLQRSIVQPIQLWWKTWEGLNERSTDATLTWETAFFNPIDPTRNTSIQALMINNLGYQRAGELLENGQQYAGGYPEILFELFTTSVAVLIAFIFGFVTSWFLRLTLLSIARGHILTALMSVYIFFGFSLLYIGGMLNFLLVWSFWIKVAAFIVVRYLEKGRYLYGVEN
jgi:hypothetical protein